MPDDSTPTNAPSGFQRCLGSLRAFCRHPFFAMFVLIGVSLAVKENYPFSHFPMYGNPGPSTTYLYIAEAREDGSHEPLPVRELAGITAPKVKKIFGSRVDAYCKENSRKEDTLSDRELASIGQDILDYLRPLAVKRSKGREPMPDKMALIQVRIEYSEGGGFSETPRTITDERKPL